MDRVLIRRTLFYPIVIGFILGIGVQSVERFSWWWSMSIMIFSSTWLLKLYFERRIRDPSGVQYSILFIFWIVVVAGASGAGLTVWNFSRAGDPALKHFIGEQVQFIGVVADDPARSGGGTRATIAIKKITKEINREGEEWVAVSSTNSIATLNSPSLLVYGDELIISGVLEAPSTFQSDAGVFDYPDYLASEHIYYQIKVSSFSFAASNQGNPLKALLYKIKNHFIDNLNKNIVSPESTLAAGLSVAGKAALPKDIQNDFTRSGTLQVVVLSGYNITIVAEAIMLLLGFLPRKIKSLCAICAVWMFGILAGASATIVRGALMATSFLLASLLGRSYDIHRAIFLSAFVMLLFNPLLLMYNSSFQFSFVATLGLIYGSPVLEKYFLWVPEIGNIRAVTVATIATQVALTPLMLYSVGSVSLAGVPANLLLFLSIPLTMLLCFTTGLGAFLNGNLALVSGFCAWIFLHYQLTVVHFFAWLPFAFITIPSFPLVLTILAYACYGVVLLRSNKVAPFFDDSSWVALFQGKITKKNQSGCQQSPTPTIEIDF